MKVAYTIIYVADVTATVQFYQDDLGIATRFVHEGGDYAELETEGKRVFDFRPPVKHSVIAKAFGLSLFTFLARGLIQELIRVPGRVGRS